MNNDFFVSLAKKNAPWVYYHPLDPYAQTSVDWYLERVCLRNSAGCLIHSENKKLPSGPQGHGFYMDFPEGKEEGIKKGDFSIALAYVHLFNSSDDEGFDIQYWFFYAYNGAGRGRVRGILGKTSSSLLEPLGQHQGDWEQVTVRSDREGKIRSIFYSQHEGGTWYAKASSPGARDGFTLSEEGRPMVYSAIHSHANYPWPGIFTVPVSYKDYKIMIFDIIDLAEKGERVLDCGEHQEIIANDIIKEGREEEPDWLFFSGRWGKKEEQKIMDIKRSVAIYWKVLGAVPWFVLLLGVLPPILITFFAPYLIRKFHRTSQGPLGPKMKKNWMGEAFE